MQISATNNVMPPLPIEPKAPAPATSGSSAPASDPVSLHRMSGLLTLLENQPPIRPDAVARGRALVADATYPSPEIINKLVGLIVGDSPK